MSKIKQWIVDYLVKKYLKGVLDKLPLDGYKTLIGIVLFLAGLVVSSPMIPSEVAEVLRAILAVVQPYGEQITTAGLGVLITGFLHKILKIDSEPKK